MSRSTEEHKRIAVASFKPLVGLLALMMLVLAAPIVRAQSEDEIKAAFLLNFARYVEWPESSFSSSESPVRICMLDSAAFESVVSGTVAGKMVGPREVEVTGVASTDSAGKCHILFIGGEEVGQAAALASLSDAAVFTVADDEGFAKNGGVANFFRSDNRIRFEINPGAAKNAGLKISSRLLRLAQLVE